MAGYVRPTGQLLLVQAAIAWSSLACPGDCIQSPTPMCAGGSASGPSGLGQGQLIFIEGQVRSVVEVWGNLGEGKGREHLLYNLPEPLPCPSKGLMTFQEAGDINWVSQTLHWRGEPLMAL